MMKFPTNLLLMSVVLMLGAVPLAARAGGVQAGVAVVDITPPVPYRLCGSFSERLSTGIHDPLCAKAIVLRQDGRQLAMVFCDLAWITLDVSRGAREAAEKKTGIRKDDILIACTHSHTGPLLGCALRDCFHEQAIAKHGADPYEKIDYPALLADRIAEAIVRAHAALRPVTLAEGLAKEPGLSFNRRFHMKDGSVVMNPGKLNPNIVRPAGPIDPDVDILLVRDAADSRPLASLTVFALHLDTLGGTLYSADFPYWLEGSLRQDLGSNFVSLFGNGTCGDINHLNFMSAQAQPVGGPETKRIGQALAARVKAELPKLKRIERPRLGGRAETVLVPMQRFSPEEIAWAKASMEKIGTDKLSSLDQVKAYKITDAQLRKSDVLPMLVQAFRLSDDVAAVALPGEVFVELGLAIKQASPFAVTMVIELAHDDIEYVPTRKAFGEGSYETVNSRVQPGGGEMAVEAAIRLLKQLKDDKS
jgi:neutral ceramidase